MRSVGGSRKQPDTRKGRAVHSSSKLASGFPLWESLSDPSVINVGSALDKKHLGRLVSENFFQRSANPPVITRYCHRGGPVSS
jgi:hypothetical protein